MSSPKESGFLRRLKIDVDFLCEHPKLHVDKTLLIDAVDHIEKLETSLAWAIETAASYYNICPDRSGKQIAKLEEARAIFKDGK